MGEESVWTCAYWSHEKQLREGMLRCFVFIHFQCLSWPLVHLEVNNTNMFYKIKSYKQNKICFYVLYLMYLDQTVRQEQE